MLVNESGNAREEIAKPSNKGNFFPVAMRTFATLFETPHLFRIFASYWESQVDFSRGKKTTTKFKWAETGIKTIF